MTESYEWISPFVRQLLAVSGVVMYMIGTGANIAFPGVLLQQLREPASALRLTPDHESWIVIALSRFLFERRPVPRSGTIKMLMMKSRN
ncbi:hypothetical protein B5X24_HaOG210157 [Helicoverpa armigera]|uniref:Uncharacterized protein n=1 Tax=Helicoverpa armigera TaxID=29058 RepID=A0A2W1BDN9_HELAM|nr:hypothetical protein B5X24_HaOG210157 [Helicoverpa armigera]